MSGAGVEVLREVALDRRPLVLHVVHRFDTGGLENGVANLINTMPESAYRHAVVALTDLSEFRHRIRRDDVGFAALHKPLGQGFKTWGRFSDILKRWRPTVVHSRNLGPLEMQPVAAWARVPLRVHGEHGRELNDLDGSNRKMQWVRRAYSPFVHRYIALSKDLEEYLVGKVGIDRTRISQIYNGVDGERFRPTAGGQSVPASGSPFQQAGLWVVGTVGRMQGVKSQTFLARAFVRALELNPSMRASARLTLVGEGPLRDECQSILVAAEAQGLAWLPGERGDVPEIMRSLDCFVLPSLAEGISNTILEAMASGLPVVATAVGGNVELVQQEATGHLVAAQDVDALAAVMVRMHGDRTAAQRMGRAGRQAVDERYSMQAMVSAYQSVYDQHQHASLQRH